MICSKCGTKLADDVIFCSECGNKVSAEVNDEKVKDVDNKCPSENSENVNNEDTKNTNKVEMNVPCVDSKSVKSNKIIGYVSIAVISAGVILGGTALVSNAVRSSMPLASLMNSGIDIVDDVRNMKSAEFSFMYDNNSIKYSGAIAIDDSEKEVWLCCDCKDIDGSLETYGFHILENNLVFAVKESSGSIRSFEHDLDEFGVNVDEIWGSARGKKLDFKTLIEQTEFSDEIEDYVNVDKINGTLRKFYRKLKSKSVQNQIEEELSVKKQRKNKYSAHFSGSELNTVFEIITDTLAETAEDSISEEVIDEMEYVLNSLSRELSSDKMVVDWELQKNKLYDMKFGVSGYADGRLKLKYGNSNKLKSLDLDVDYYGYFDIKCSLDKVNAVKSIENEFPSDLYRTIR